MLLNIVLFIAFFCFYCCLIPTKSTAAQDSFDSFIPSIKEAFSEEYDPTSDTIEETKNPILIVPSIPSNPSNKPKISDDLTYQELKEFVKVHNLQATVKNICKKSYNRCRKAELIKALQA